MNLRIKYSVEIDRLKKFPDLFRTKAEQRFLLIKEYQDEFLPNEKLLHGQRFRKTKCCEKFCDINKFTTTTFYRWLRDYKKYGIEGLISLYGLSPLSKILPTSRRIPKKRHISNIRLAIPSDKPFECLKTLAQAISENKDINEQTKHSFLNALKYILQFSVFQKQPKILSSLTEEEKQQIEQYRAGSNKKQSKKAKAILMMNENSPVLDIGLETAVSFRTIYRWAKEFNAKRMNFFVLNRSSSKFEEIKTARTTRVIDIIHKQPSFYDINRTSWTYGTIAEAYQKTYKEHISNIMVQRIVKATGITWRRARKVWTSPDPLYHEKIRKVVHTLQNIKGDEAFFFVDEAGPYRVKKYGGKSLSYNGKSRVIPESHPKKGSVQFIAALDASSNQIFWQFIKSKSSANIILMLEKLCTEYAAYSKIYITWDDISSHSSQELNLWIKKHNITVRESHVGPEISIVPLPSRAQFLNVIEAVFGGMKKAVIYNSDYKSKQEMEYAVSRHFEERNKFFKENPKRAGNKIWDKGLFKVEELPGGLFKRM